MGTSWYWFMSTCFVNNYLDYYDLVNIICLTNDHIIWEWFLELLGTLIPWHVLCTNNVHLVMWFQGWAYINWINLMEHNSLHAWKSIISILYHFRVLLLSDYYLCIHIYKCRLRSYSYAPPWHFYACGVDKKHTLATRGARSVAMWLYRRSMSLKSWKNLEDRLVYIVVLLLWCSGTE